MATISHRGVLRSLPVLFALLLALFGAPSTGEQVTGASPAPAITSSAAASTPDAPASPATATPEVPAAEPVSGSPVADQARVLAAQSTAGTASSRAPPAATA
jgi:hypothetical protein